MSQLALDLLAVAPPTLDNFVEGRNLECLACLRELAGGGRGQRLVYLWGLPGSGRSHLLRALAGGSGARLIDAQSPTHHFAFSDAARLYLVDDAHRLDEPRQQALFHLINQVRAEPAAALVAAGDAPPLGLKLRDDLRTRLGWGLVFELHLLSDEEKAAALRTVAAERGVAVSADVVPWLLNHRSRDIRVLLELFDALDRHAFARKRPITLPLLREWLRTDEGRNFGRRPPDAQD
jgi:DnaA family protein